MCTSVVAVSLPVLAVLAAPAPAGAAAAPGNIKITEWAYNGSEFFELTNVGLGAEDLTGWSYSDSTRTPAPAATSTSLSGFGRVAPGESVIVSEVSADAFRTAWGLAATVKVVGGNAVNLGRSDEINIYDETGAQVDRLTYNDAGTGDVAGPRTDTSSAWVSTAALGANTASAWTKSTLADAEGSWAGPTISGVVFYGSPGSSSQGGFDATANRSANGLIRITEMAYNGSEFFEFTNIGSAPEDMTGWSYSDSTRTPAPAATSTSLSAFGNVAAGESVIVSEVSADAFRTTWGLDPSVKVIGGNAVNLGRSDEVNVYDETGALVDRLTYNDAGTGDVAGPRTDTSSAWVSARTLGKNKASGWTKSTLADAEDSWAGPTISGVVFYGSPGVSNFGFPFDAVPPEEPAETVKINEVESNGDVVGDWVELTNTGASAVDVSGWTLEDSGDNPAVAIPSGTTIAPGAFYAIYTEIPGPGFGLGADDSITLYRGTTVVDSYSWAGGHAATTYGRCPDGTGEFRVTTVATRGAANACSPIRVNEVLTTGTPDKVEIVNLSASPVDIAGWVVKDSTEASPTTLPAPSVVPAHGYLVVSTNATLDASDSVRLFDSTSALIDSATWATDPTPSLGRCADGVGAFKLTESATIGTANQCPGVVTEAWPGSPTVTPSDDAVTFNQDASGLAFDRSDANTLWVAQNKLGTLWKMTKSGSTWVPATGWSRTPKYNDGSGAPDSEGIMVGPDGAVYLATERDNSNSGVSKNRVLRYDANAATGATLNATDEWDLNPLLPTLGANLGLEGITWIPDSFLVAGGFVDDSTDAAYLPSHYPDHGTGLYVVAVEGTGMLYVVALDQTAAVQETAHLVATVDPRLLTNAGPPSVMDVSFDPELGRLWAVCDDSCNGTTVQLKLAGGAFVVDHAYDRPAGMPNLNNEGFALAPQSTCVAGKKEVVWSDDGDTDTHSLRSGTFPCHSLASASGTPGSVVYGQATSVAVQVTATGATATGGTVSLLDSGTVVGSAELASGAASIAVPAKSLAPGVRNLSIAYAGDSKVAPATGTVALTVAKSTGSLTAADASVAYGKPLSLPVQVGSSASGVVPTGTVTVSSGTSIVGIGTLAGGTATVSVPAGSLAVGGHALTVAYAGDNLVGPAGDEIQVTVGKAAATVSADDDAVVYGKAAAVPVQVSADGATPTGTVTLRSGTTVVGTGTLSGGRATVAIAAKSLDPGRTTLTVEYAGDDTVDGGSATATLTVTQARSSLSKPSVTPGKVVVKKTRAVLTVKVGAAGVSPTGKVTITGGGIAKQTVMVRGGKAVVRLPVFRTTGAKSLTVTYLGDRFVSGDTAKVTVKVVKK
ncbi:hypothetical protein ASC77_22165 [Nocardioides sp. Root1257]|nr:hypothetical protein ASC77_22165 [Nocardioides sp. Root1257]KRC41875.1 hypothetical protein ASE24_21955 [Nocardioides sp. Root224]